MVTLQQSYLILFTVLNIFLYSNADYVGKANFQEILQNKIEFTCEYTGADSDPGFLGWYKDNEPISNDQTDHYVIKTVDKVTKLNITWNETDQQIQTWWARTNKTGQEKPDKCVFNRIRPTPQGISSSQESKNLTVNLSSVRRAEKENVSFKCILAPSPAKAKQVTWKFSKDGEHFGNLPNGVRDGDQYEIIIDRVDRTHQGYYRCSLNRVKFTAILRVKDRLAALWPFLGIVCTVIILVIGIFILEKRQKIAKKKAAAEEEVIEPLASSGNKLSDNENQKTNVIA